MSSPAIQPDLIISLSQDRIRLNLRDNPESGRSAWQASFGIEHIFLEEHISKSLDQALLENPTLIDEFPCVEIVVLDRPNIYISRKYLDSEKLGELAARHLRLRAGDTLTTDLSADDNVFCYSLPTETLSMLREYYSNINCHHLTSILWYSLSLQPSLSAKDSTRLFFILIGDILVVVGERNQKLFFSKNFSIRNESNFLYYSIACSRMMKAKEHWFVTIQDEEVKYSVPDTSILKIDQHLHLPSLHVLMAQYNVCGS